MNEEKKFMNLSEKDMKDLLIELFEMPHWNAIRRYNYIRSLIAENSLCTLDPLKDATLMARNQGIRIGLVDLESFIKLEKENREKKESGIEE